MAKLHKGKDGASRLRAALNKLYRQDTPRGGLHPRLSLRTDDAEVENFGDENQFRLSPKRSPDENGGVDASPHSNIYVARDKGPYLRDMNREMRRDNLRSCQRAKSNATILFTTGLAIVVLLVTIFFHVSEG